MTHKSRPMSEVNRLEMLLGVELRKLSVMESILSELVFQRTKNPADVSPAKGSIVSRRDLSNTVDAAMRRAEHMVADDAPLVSPAIQRARDAARAAEAAQAEADRLAAEADAERRDTDDE